MLRLVIIFFCAMFLSTISVAGEIGKKSYLSFEKDGKTGEWTGVCHISVNGVNKKETYSGRMRWVSYLGVGVPDIFWVISSDNPIYTESAPGVYEFQAKLTGREIIAEGVFYVPEIISGQNGSFSCDPTISLGPNVGFNNLHNTDLTHNIPSEPN